MIWISKTIDLAVQSPGFRGVPSVDRAKDWAASGGLSMRMRELMTRLSQSARAGAASAFRIKTDDVVAIFGHSRALSKRNLLG